LRACSSKDSSKVAQIVARNEGRYDLIEELKQILKEGADDD